MGGKIGVTELLLIIAVLLLFFGGKKIPEFMRGLGQGVREFKKSIQRGRRAFKFRDKKVIFIILRNLLPAN